MCAPVAILNESFLSDAFAGREGQTLPFKGRAHAAPALCKTTLFNWAVGILVGITSLAGTPFFRKTGAGCIKKGAGAPFFPQKGGQCPLFEEKSGSRQKNDTKMYRLRFPLVSVW